MIFFFAQMRSDILSFIISKYLIPSLWMMEQSFFGTKSMANKGSLILRVIFGRNWQKPKKTRMTAAKSIIKLIEPKTILDKQNKDGAPAQENNIFPHP